MRPGRDQVVAVIVTHSRRTELERLLKSLRSAGPGLAGVVISDHSPGPTGADGVESVVEGAFRVVVRADASNPGPGAGWANAVREAQAQFADGFSAVWYLDDDVVIPEDGLTTLRQAALTGGFGGIAPLLANADGELWGFPEPEDKMMRKTIRKAKTPSEARKLLGDAPQAACWCTGACFLVACETIGRVGLHREDFWMLGEDLEYSMRIAAAGGCGFTTLVTVPHLPPQARDVTATRIAGSLKFCALLQNLSYLSFHSPASRHMKSYLLGNFRRFLRTYGLRRRPVTVAATCLWNGAVKAEPAGMATGAALRESIRRDGI